MEPIDHTSYKHWSSSSRVTQLDQRSLPGSGSGETEAMPLSFAEVMRLVQEGKAVPGVTKLDVEPTNQTPAPAQMERIRKPWEIPACK